MLTTALFQLHLTPAEAERMRHHSYKRQLEAGMRHPGRAGITSDRFGDAKIWNPNEKEYSRAVEGSETVSE